MICKNCDAQAIGLHGLCADHFRDKVAADPNLGTAARQPVELTRGERAALDYLRDQETINCAAPRWEIAKAAGLSPRGSSVVLRRLEDRNLVAPHNSGGIRCVALTLAGARAIGRPF